MARPPSLDPACKVNITLKKSLLRKLELEVPMSKNKSLSGVIASRLETSTGRLFGENHLLIVAKLKEKANFADFIGQLQTLNGSLQIISIAGDLNLVSSEEEIIEVVIEK